MAGGHNHGASDYHPGEMDISDHKSTFSGFLKVAEWGTVSVIQWVGLATFAFAMGLGWWTGLIVYVVVGAAAGAIMKMGPAWWVTLALTTVALGVGGAITMGLMALGG